MADQADQADEPTAAGITDPGDEAQETAGVEPVAPPSRRRRFPAVLTAVFAVLVGLIGWAGWRDAQARHDDDAREQMVAAGREVVLALTTIDHTRIDDDVQRILDASTGAFRADFAQRAESFTAAARKAQSTSVGTVSEAGVESADGESARVLVALTVMTSNRGTPAQQPKSWRTRVTVTKVDDMFKGSSVEFVP